MILIMARMIMMRVYKLFCTGVKLGPLVDAFGKLKTRILAQIFIMMLMMMVIMMMVMMMVIMMMVRMMVIMMIMMIMVTMML